MTAHSNPSASSQSSRQPLHRIGLGAFTLLMFAVPLVMVGGLLATDQVLRDTSEAHARTDAGHIASMIEQAIIERTEGLSIFEGVARGATPDHSTEALRSVATAYLAEHPGCRRVAVFTTKGEAVIDQRIAGSADDGTIITATDTSRTRARLVRRGERETDLVLARTFVTDVGTLTARAVCDAWAVIGPGLRNAPPERERLGVWVDGALVFGDPRAQPSARRAAGAAFADLPGGGRWEVEITHASDVGRLRIGLWSLGLLTIALFGIAVARERRQSVRITERSAELERLSTELLRANRAKSEFLANVSHELRTPLNAIVGFVELLKDGVYGDLTARQVGPVDRIAVSATHLRHLVDQVLDIAKIAAGRLEVHLEPVALRTFVLNVASELESLFSERELALSITIPAVMPRVRTDPTHLRQILVNLLGNAVTHTPSGGISIRARIVAAPREGRRDNGDDASLAARAPDRARPWVALQVADTGVGIAAADHERIFDEFEQVNAGPRGNSMERGTGLGLAISRRLARLLEGDITLESQPGKGSTFTVWLPLEAGVADGNPG